MKASMNKLISVVVYAIAIILFCIGWYNYYLASKTGGLEVSVIYLDVY